jgi:hypothetical protein
LNVSCGVHHLETTGVDYNGKIFDMDRNIFAKDISENGVIKMTGLTERIAVVAIDKHGNEKN